MTIPKVGLQKERLWWFGHYLILIISAISFGLSSCSKEEDPIPEDLFVGAYDLEEVFEEYNPNDQDKADEKFLAPMTFIVTKSEFLDPNTGELVAAYKFFINDSFMGLAEEPGSNGLVLVGTQTCPNEDDLSGVSITLQESGLYKLNMLNCVGREVRADYTRLILLE